ncbi:MAG: aldehyde dehydrogenase family protein [Conexivisphaera sp.]|jgi:1-pyrroline-5-carboxylate dehydrogenase
MTKVTYTSSSLDKESNARYEEALSSVERELLGKGYPMKIGGRDILALEYEVRSPVDMDIVVGRFQRGGRDEAIAALNSAVRAFDDWSRRDWRERAEVMRRVAEAVERRKFLIAAMMAYEVGKNRVEAVAEVNEALEAIRYYASLVEKEEGYVRRMAPGSPGEETWSVARPRGPWFVISPFNFPAMLGSGMVQGALITGNTVVWKPSEEASLTAHLMYDAYVEGGVPTGAINLLTGPGELYEDVIVGDRRVAGIAFTGSKDVGHHLYREFVARQPYPKPVVLETGSKNPTVVTAKADLTKAVEGVARAAFGYGGQKCSATSRLYVQEEVKDEFMEALASYTRSLTVGDPRKDGVFMGPLINARAYTNFARNVQEGMAAGGRLVTGGRQLRDGWMSRGFYVEPTIMDGVPEGHYLFRDELFMPLLVVAPFRDLDDAISKVNDTDYGLTAGIFSEDEDEVREFMEHVEFGVLYANRRGGATTGAWPGAQTFVGWKASGATGRGIGGPYYLLNFLQEQARTYVR